MNSRLSSTKFASIVIAMFVTAFEVAATASIDFPPSRSSWEYLDVQHYVQDREIKTLSTDDEKQFLALLKEQTTGFGKGTAIILPDINQSLQRQAAISKLYDQLNDYGWNSLLLTMPSVMEPVFGAPKTDDAEQSEANDSDNAAENSGQVEVGTILDQSEPTQTASADDQTTDSDSVSEPDPNINWKAFHRDNYFSEQTSELLQTQIQQRLQAAWQVAETYPGFFLLICQGKTCHWLTQLFADPNIPKPDALVMLSAHMPQTDLNQTLASQVSMMEFPILDLYLSQDNPWVNKIVLERRKMARKNYKTDYRQRQLFSSIDYQGQQRRTIKEIYGFLTAVGM